VQAATVLPPLRTGTDPHCVEFRDGRRHRVIHDLERISDAIGVSGHVVWLDLVAPSHEQLALLQQEFSLHPLAVENAASRHERPKVDAYDGYLFVIIHPVTWSGDRLVAHELAIFAGERFLVTIRNEPQYPIAEVERRWHSHDGELGGDCGFLLYTLLDTIVDGYFLISDRLEEWIEELQTGLFERAGKSDATLREIFEPRNDIHNARRAVVPVRDIVQPILRGDVKVLGSDHSAYYRDVYDHAIRVIDQMDSARDLVSGALEAHLSLVANRQNEVTKQLAVIATIFLPLSFITGFFGQNFGYMVNAIASPAPFFGLGLGSQVVFLAILLVYFRRKGWF
jgi:magnesium transporter